MKDISGGSRAVLVTGCSSGIGRATAAVMADAGWPVYASARRQETLDELDRLGCRPLALDAVPAQDHGVGRGDVRGVHPERGAGDGDRV
ncbi:MAG TPA: SDR family NAD(P)-dependent oxidoreductase, partial [Actinomycetes bacterium]|nr:SDR family NAD(P)-dependent oxidoreductase [Actinomycetes bacterium]